MLLLESNEYSLTCFHSFVIHCHFHSYALQGMLRDFSIDVHEVNAMTDDSMYDSSSDSEGARARRQSLESASEREQQRIINSDDDYSEETHLARAHWIQLYKTNMQVGSFVCLDHRMRTSKA
jgi:hypothetical protein